MKKIFILTVAAAIACVGCGDDAKEADTSGISLTTKFTVTFELNGGSGVEPVAVDSGTQVQAPATPTKTKSCFAGWYSNSTFSDAFDFSAPITKNTTVYAKWSKLHTVTFVLNGGTGTSTCQVCDSAKFTLPNEPTREGYSFVDWCVDTAFSAPFNPYSGHYDLYPPHEFIYDTLKVTKDTTLYALWINGEKKDRWMDSHRYYWCAYEDELGLYSNQTTGSDDYDGRNNTGGEANDVCRSRGSGWYLPSRNEGFNIDTTGNYWTSTRTSGAMASYVDRSSIIQPSEALKTTPMRVRCVWRPLYDE